MKRPGQQLADHIDTVRKKFGRYPADGHEPLEGHEYFSVRPYPAFPKGVPRNREEERQMRKFYPRSVRLDTFTRKLGKGTRV